jgi:RimJ/RimL family protein N-acetyltransferase
MPRPLVPAEVPVIETARLRLRGHERADFEACKTLWSDPIVTRHIGGRPFSAEEVWTRLLRYVGHWAVMGFGFWAVEEKASGRFVGEVGFADFKRDELPPSPDPEMGWVLAPWAHGKGYATEAVRVALAWGTGHLSARRTFCLIMPGNQASVRVAEKCGFRGAGDARYKGATTLLYERPLRE